MNQQPVSIQSETRVQDEIHKLALRGVPRWSAPIIWMKPSVAQNWCIFLMGFTRNRDITEIIANSNLHGLSPMEI